MHFLPSGTFKYGWGKRTQEHKTEEPAENSDDILMFACLNIQVVRELVQNSKHLLSTRYVPGIERSTRDKNQVKVLALIYRWRQD